MASKQHAHYTEQDSEAGMQENMGDEFLESIFTLEESQKLQLCKSGLSAPTVEVLVQIEGVEFRTMAAMRIYARYFHVTFLAFFYVSIYLSRLFSSLTWKKRLLRVHQSSFFRLM